MGLTSQSKMPSLTDQISGREVVLRVETNTSTAKRATRNSAMVAPEGTRNRTRRTQQITSIREVIGLPEAVVVVAVAVVAVVVAAVARSTGAVGEAREAGRSAWGRAGVWPREVAHDTSHIDCDISLIRSHMFGVPGLLERPDLRKVGR